MTVPRKAEVYLDTQVLDGELYPQELSISGEAFGARTKGRADVQLVGWDRMNLKGYGCRRVP